MEINPYIAGQLGQLESQRPEEWRQGNAPAPEQSPADPGQDRVDIIAAQNMAAKDIDFFDLETALKVLGQVENDLSQFGFEDVEKLFHYDNLRQTTVA